MRARDILLPLAILLLPAFLVIALLCACGDGYSGPEDALDAGTLPVADIVLGDKNLGDAACESPAGHYTFHFTVYKNTCPQHLIPKTSWTKSGTLPSMECGVSWREGWSTHKTDPSVIVYCDYYVYTDWYSVGYDTRCVIYSLVTKEETEVCRFSYGTAMESPL